MKKKFNITYQGEDIRIRVLDKEWELEDLYSELGDLDIVECNEIGSDGLSTLIDSKRNVYIIYNIPLSALKFYGVTTICKVAHLIDYINLNLKSHRDFLAWYYSTARGYGDELTQQDKAIKLMFEEAGWVCTDPGTMQFRSTIVEDEEYRFYQRTVYPDGYQDWVTDTYKFSEERYEDLMQSCLSFGYEYEDIDSWIRERKEIDLMLECLFELQN